MKRRTDTLVWEHCLGEVHVQVVTYRSYRANAWHLDPILQKETMSHELVLKTANTQHDFFSM